MGQRGPTLLPLGGHDTGRCVIQTAPVNLEFASCGMISGRLRRLPVRGGGRGGGEVEEEEEGGGGGGGGGGEGVGAGGRRKVEGDKICRHRTEQLLCRHGYASKPQESTPMVTH